jgi:chromosome segregation ATPase
MKSNLAAIILILACLGLGIVVWEQHQKNTDQTENLDQTINTYSNKVTDLSTNLNEQVRVKTTLQRDLDAAQRKAAIDLDAANKEIAATAKSLVRAQTEANSYSNDTANLQSKLSAEVLARARLETNLAVIQRKAASDLDTANKEIAATSSSLDQARSDARAAAAAAKADADEKSKRIAELEIRNAELDKESNDLRGSMANLDAQMQAAQKKLDANDGDRNLLLSELKRVQAQKEEMQSKLSDLAYLKEHVKTMKEDLAMDRRADWIRRGLYEAASEKGGQRLINPELPGSSPTNPPLDVELHQNGSVKVNSASTNAPAARAPSTNSSPARAPSARLAPDAGL